MNEYEMGHSLDVLDQENGWNAKDDLRVCFFLFFFFFFYLFSTTFKCRCLCYVCECA